MNQVMLHGKVSKDPFYKSGADGKASLLSIAVEVQDRNREERFDCYMFGSAADADALAYSENDWVFVTGRISMDTYNKEYPKLKVYVDQMHKVSSTSGIQAMSPQAVEAEVEATDDLDF